MLMKPGELTAVVLLSVKMGETFECSLELHEGLGAVRREGVLRG